MDTDRIANSTFNNQPEGNRLRGRLRNHQWKYLQANLNKCKIFYSRKKLTDRDGWKRFIDEADAHIDLYGQANLRRTETI